MHRAVEQAVLAEVVGRLTRDFPEVAPDVIEAAITQAHAEFDDSPVRGFIPLLVEKRVRRQFDPQGLFNPGRMYA